MWRRLLAAAALTVGLTLIGSSTSAPGAAGDFWVGQWSITISAGERGVLGIDRISESEALAEWTARAHQIGPKVEPKKEGCLAFLHATYTWNGGGTWIGCSKHASSGVAEVTTDNFLTGLTSDGTGIGEIFVGQNPANTGGVSVDHSRSCTASGSATTYSCTTLFTGHRADRVVTGTTKTISEPAPGEFMTVSSPPIPEEAATVDVTVSSSTGNLGGTEVFGPGYLVVLKGLLFLNCWELLGRHDFTPADRIRLCALYVRSALGRASHEDVHRAGAGSREARAAATWSTGIGAARTCRAKRLSLRAKVRKKKIVSVKLVKRKLTPKSVLYKCTTEGGTTRITIDGRRKGGLRKALGKTLKLTIARSKKAPRRAAKLSVTFDFTG